MSILDEIKLPKGSPKEELEQLSKDKLRPIFDIKMFEFRPEEYRDKGLDISIELKYKGSNTNFRFLVQLKSTETKEPNLDGSYSWQIDTSNIQYLLNGGLPAYYVCYVKQVDTFYVRQINDFIKEISKKDRNWNSQDTHTLRTSQILDKTNALDLYEEVRKKCEKTRELIEKLHLERKEKPNRKVAITSEYEITDETSIVELIERNGLTLINEGKWKDVILLNEKVSSNITSALYNLTVGIAAYYTSNLFDSLAFFQKASRQVSQLPNHLIEHLTYFDALVKYSIGFITQEEYSAIVDSLKQSEHLQYYIQIEQAKRKYFDSQDPSRFTYFENEMFSIINDKKIQSNIRFIASCEYLLFWGSKINMEYFQSIALINALEESNGYNESVRIEASKNWIGHNLEWERFYKKLNNDILSKDDFFAFNMCKLNEVKVRFEFIVFSSLIRFELASQESTSWFNDDSSKLINQMLTNLDVITKNYRNLHYVENVIAALSTKYELLKFQREEEKSNQVINEIQTLIDLHDLKEQKVRLEFLLNEGTIEDKIHLLITDTLGKHDSDKNEFDKLVLEMREFDKLEKQNMNTRINSITIELFPIGHFSIPKEKLDILYDILGIDSYKLTRSLDYFFENGIIAVLNILNEKIIQEGYVNGNQDDKGIESWRRIRVIRENLFKNGMYRQNLKH